MYEVFVFVLHFSKKFYLYFMKRTILIIVVILAVYIGHSQSRLIKEVFRLIPADRVYDLTVAARDSMLHGKTFYPASNDSEEIIAFNYGMSSFVNDYLYVSFSFETGQRGGGMIEIRSFKKLNGDNLVMVSKTGGSPGYTQHDLSLFIYNKNKKLTRTDHKILPAIDNALFLKPGIPDSAKNFIMKNSNITFDLSEEEIMLNLNSDNLMFDEIAKKWLKGYVITFDWIKDRFVVSSVNW